MKFPKPTEQNIELSKEDLEQTGEMKRLTKNISTLIQNKENEIASIYNEFSHFAAWVSSQQDMNNAQGQIMLKLDELQSRLKNMRELLQNIFLMTKHEEKKECRKVMIKVDIESDFEITKGFARQLDYPRGVVHLAKEIADIARKTKTEANEDLEIEEKTEALLQKMVDMVSRVEVHIAKFSAYIASGDFSNIQDQLQGLINEINREEEAFKKLSEFETIHLNLLLKLYEDEREEINKERDFGDDEKKIGS